MHDLIGRKVLPQPDDALIKAISRKAGRKYDTQLLSKVFPLATLIVLIGAVAIGHPLFVSAYGLSTLASAASVIMLMALGQFLPVILGGIDLSIGALAAFGTILLAIWLPFLGFGAVIVMLTLLSLAGLLNGLIIVIFQIPSFIATLGTLGLWTGVSLVVSGTSAISVNHGYQAIAWMNGAVADVPISFLFALIVMACVGVILKFTSGGRLSLYAIGLGEPAALMSGVRVSLVRILCFAIAGLCAGFTALVLVAQDISGDPTSASALLLPSIAAVVVGGNAITGGIGSVQRVLIGALIITVVQNGIGIVGISPFYQSIVYGAILLVAAALTLDRSGVSMVK
ncbi:MAG: ABC transporter permease [Acidiphilium sp.]